MKIMCQNKRDEYKVCLNCFHSCGIGTLTVDCAKSQEIEHIDKIPKEHTCEEWEDIEEA